MYDVEVEACSYGYCRSLDCGYRCPARANGVTERVSVGSGGQQGNLESDQALDADAMTDDGRYVVFQSWASNLVPNDTNGAYDVFLRDRGTRQTLRVSVSSTGGQGSQGSFGGAISADARYVAFDSDADDLVAGDANGATDVFVRDRKRKLTDRVVLAPTGAPPDPGSFGGSLSASGRFVAVSSRGSARGSADAYVIDRRSGKTRLLNAPLAGYPQQVAASTAVAISADGRRACFGSSASNLVPGDTNETLDVFVRNLSAW